MTSDIYLMDVEEMAYKNIKTFQYTERSNLNESQMMLTKELFIGVMFSEFFFLKELLFIVYWL